MRLFLLLLVLVGCTADKDGTLAQRQGILSLDFYVLQFVDRADIVGLSTDSQSDFAYLREDAVGIEQFAPSTEEILASGAATVVRSYGGDARTLAFLRRIGVEVIDIGYPNSFAAIEGNEHRLAGALASNVRPPTAPTPSRPPSQKSALYITPSGTTTGPGSLIHELLMRSGYTNFEQRPGWHALPLEQLASSRPDHIVTGFYDNRNQYAGWWSVARHPLAAEFLNSIPRTDLPGSTLSCSAWPLFDAAAQLAESSL